MEYLECCHSICSYEHHVMFAYYHMGFKNEIFRVPFFEEVV